MSVTKTANTSALRKARWRGAMAAHDGLTELDNVRRLAVSARPCVSDFSKPLMWDLPECMDQFRWLAANPPLHSVVVRIEPPMAKKILAAANDLNRPLNKGAFSEEQAKWHA